MSALHSRPSRLPGGSTACVGVGDGHRRLRLLGRLRLPGRSTSRRRAWGRAPRRRRRRCTRRAAGTRAAVAATPPRPRPPSYAHAAEPRQRVCGPGGEWRTTRPRRPARAGPRRRASRRRTPRRRPPGRRSRRPPSPTAIGSAATARSEPARATALLMPLAMPALSSGAAAITVAVSGATIRARPRANTVSPGSTSRHQVTSGPTTISQIVPAAITIGPNVIGIRGPIRWPSAPPRAARASITTVTGSVARPGLEGGVAADGLQLQDEEEQDRPERGVDDQRHRVGGAEGAVGEEPERDHRLRPAALGDVERHAAEGGGGQGVRHQRAVPVGEGEGQRGQRDRGEGGAGDVEAAVGAGVPRLRHEALREPDGQRGERQVDEEDPAPRGVVDQQPADQRADGRGDPAEARPGTDRAAAVLGREGALDHRQAARA